MGWDMCVDIIIAIICRYGVRAMSIYVDMGCARCRYVKGEEWGARGVDIYMCCVDMSILGGGRRGDMCVDDMSIGVDMFRRGKRNAACVDI
jgi:hypothetical protein